MSFHEAPPKTFMFPTCKGDVNGPPTEPVSFVTSLPTLNNPLPTPTKKRNCDYRYQ